MVVLVDWLWLRRRRLAVASSNLHRDASPQQTSFSSCKAVPNFVPTGPGSASLILQYPQVRLVLNNPAHTVRSHRAALANQAFQYQAT